MRRGGIVLAELVAQSPRVDADDWIEPSVEVRRLAVHLHRQHVLFEGSAVSGQRVLDDVGEERGEAVGARKNLAREDADELGPNCVCLRRSSSQSDSVCLASDPINHEIALITVSVL